MRLLTCLVLVSSTAIAAEYGFSDYYFVDPDRPWHFDGRYRAVARAEFENHKRGHVDYSDATAGLYYTQFLNDENSLTYELGYDLLRFDWEKNPRFKQKNFNYLIGSLGLVSTTLERWRWVLNAGFSVDAAYFDFAKSAVGHAMLWGRYHFADCCGVNIGVLGWYGVLNGRAWPIIGFDWKFNEQWSANAVYPCDFSLNYAFADNWSVDLAYACFGSPYRYPHRAHDGKNGYHGSIFEVFANAAELCLKFKFEHLLRASLGAGWNFGGWILVKDHENHHGKYYHYNSAPYIQGSVALTF
jgi:opacity protein-like surface antigen